MKVLQINCEYKTGSTGKIADCIAQGLKQCGHEVFTCYGLHKHSDDGESACICTSIEHKINALISRIDGIPYGGYFWANRRFKNIVLSFNPDIVHVHCINGYTINIYNLLKFLAKRNIKTVVTLHAEFFFTGGCSHSYDCNQWLTGCKKCDVYRKTVSSWFFDRAEASWKKMYMAFSAFNPKNIRIIAVSPWLENRAKRSAILRPFNVSCIGNGVDTDVFKFYTNKKGKDVLDETNDRKCILFVTAHFSMNESDSKGGKYLVELAKLTPEYKYIVVARSSDIIKSKLPHNVYYIGCTDNQSELAYLYSSADVSITLGKRETFSMIVAESLCCGTPIIGFQAGGPESIGMREFSEFVSYGNVKLLHEALEKMLRKNINKYELSINAAKVYGKNVMFENYANIYNELKLGEL